MINPVSVKEAITLEREVIANVHVAREAGHLDEAVSIMLEYVPSMLVCEMVEAMQDMLADPDPEGYYPVSKLCDLYGGSLPLARPKTKEEKERGEVMK